MISPEAAWELLAAELERIGRVAPLPQRREPRSRAAGRRLARDVVATTDLPSADVSALDGFALAGEVAPEAPFRVAGVTLAGGAEVAPLARGEAARVMTGAPVPAGADRVVGFEEVEDGTDGVRVRGRATATASGAAIRRRGEVVRAGDALLPAGTPLTPAALALLASQGIDEVEVRGAPRVELVVTGDEVVRGGSPRPGEVRDSHTDFLVAELARLGIDPLTGPPARDDRRALELRLTEALARADVVLTCGGVSMGDADLVPATLAHLGCRALFHGVAVQPGKPLLAAVRDQTLVFGLPGNPGSVMTSYWLFVRPALERRLGSDRSRAGFWSQALTAVLTRPVGAGRGRDRFVPARIAAASGHLEATPVSPKGSHDLVAFAVAEALLRVRAGDPARDPGDLVELLLLDR